MWILVLITGWPTGHALAHGSLHEAIERKSRQVEESPEDALLRFERGLLYQEHGDIGLALEDFHTALQLEPSYQICHLPMAQLYRDTGALEQALLHINIFLEQEPRNPFGYETRASIYQKQSQFIQAVADLRTMAALKNDNAIRPDDYFKLADGMLLAYPGQYGQAIEALEEGLKRLGDIISLQSRLVELEISAGRYASALQRINQIMAPLPRKDKWLAKRTQVLQLMQQPATESRQVQEKSRNSPDREAAVSKTAVPSPDPSTPVSPRLAEVIRGPYLQSGTPASMVIKWRTSAATNSMVWYGASPGSLTQTVEQSGARTNHEITLTGLAPNTRYYYAIGDNAGMAAGGTLNYFFKTSPPHGSIQPVRAWVLGDCGTADDRARSVRDGYYAYAGNNYTDLILLLGDNAYDEGTDAQYQDALFENMYEEKLIQSVLWSTPGNHDYGSASASSQTGPYFDIFTFPKNGEAGGLPSGTEAYYSFDYANIHFVVLDSHDSGRQPGDPMLLWLENDLHATQQEWLVVFFHHPPYSKGSHDSDDESKLIEMRENVLPILEAAGVDLVLSGHSHSYERSYLINGHYGPSNTLAPAMILDDGNGRLEEDGAYQKNEFGPSAGKGAVYTCAGSSGKVSNAPLNHPVMYFNALSLGSLSLEITNKQLDLKFIGVDGGVMDHFTIRKFTPVGNPPTVAVTSPADGAFFNSIQPITLRAQASDTDGNIEEVVFFINGDSVGVDLSAPYALTWTPPAEGSYSVKARARDNDGNLVASGERRFYVGLIQTCSRVNSGDDDAEEEIGGNMSLSSTDLEMINDPSNGDQWVGMRFTGLNIPANAIIDHAQIQFSVEDNNNDNPCQLYIYGEANARPESFSDADNNISSRPLTLASVSWQPPNWQEIGDSGPAQQTPNLAPILQEIVEQPGYSASSAIVFIIEGQGRRTAESYNGMPLSAPQLCVEYSFCQASAIQASSSADNICPGEPVTLSASPAASYLWSTGATTAQASVQPTATTTYSLTAWDDNGCPATAEVTVNVQPAPQLSFEIDAVTFCPGQGVEITAPSGFAQYHWSNGQATPTVLIDSPGVWSLTVTNASGCTASASLNAAEQPPLDLQISSSAAGACAGQPVTLSASPASSYQWSNGATSPQITVQPSATTTYFLIARDQNGCPAMAEATVQVWPAPQVSFGTNAVSFCHGQGMEVNAPSGFAQYQWSNGQATPTVFINSPGIWSLTVTDANGCSASTSLEASELPLLNLQASSSDDAICAGQSATLSASAGESFLWSNGATAAQVTVQPSATTTYGLTAWDENGCPATASVEVAVVPQPDFEVEQQNNQLTATGLADPGQYSFLWSTGENTLAISPGSAGLYCLTVTGNEGCSSETCFEFVATGTKAPSLPRLWKVFPNPFTDYTRIRPAAAPEKLQIGVFTLLGEPVPFRRRMEGDEVVLEFKGLPAGFYSIVISDGEDIEVAVMVKQ
ncbi:MAG: metallophosphoesterase [Lewinellaceae bacterium]|nr:metallophosphoesterase [Phaeodactylibacter sp.]MCB9040837.1 metallophosphoesterase [Lewinellaceae bacterium]